MKFWWATKSQCQPKVRVNKGIFHCFRVSLSKLVVLKATSARIPQRQNRSKHMTTRNSPEWRVNGESFLPGPRRQWHDELFGDVCSDQLSTFVSSHGAWTLGNLFPTNTHKIHICSASTYLLSTISYLVSATRTLYLSWSQLHSHPSVCLPWLRRQVECLIAISRWRVRNLWTSWRAF